jgi:hypothetical protein
MAVQADTISFRKRGQSNMWKPVEWQELRYEITSGETDPRIIAWQTPRNMQTHSDGTSHVLALRVYGELQNSQHGPVLQ